MRSPLLTWNIFYYGIPINVIGVLATIAPPDSVGPYFWDWTAVALISHLVMAPFAWASIQLFRRHKNRILEIGGLFVAGAVRGLAIDILIRIFGLEQHTQWWFRIFNSSLTIPILAIGLSFFLESRRTFEKEFRELFSQALVREMEQSGRDSETTPSALMQSARKKVDTAFAPLRQAIEGILEGDSSPGNLGGMVNEIREMLDETLRPLSHELWKPQELKPPIFRLRGLIRIAALETRLRVPLVSLGGFLLVFLGSTARYGVRDAEIRGTTATLFILAFYVVYKDAVAGELFSLHTCNVITLSVFAIVPSLLSPLLFPQFLSVPWDIPAALLGNLLLVLTLIVVNLFELSINAREQVLDLVRDHLEKGNVAKYASSFVEIQEQVDFATYLHGEVQSELVATSLQLQRAADSGDVVMASEALEKVAHLLRRDHSSHSFFDKVESEDKLQAIIRAWDGIVAITAVLPSEKEVGAATKSLTVKALEEIIANAVRHGGATEIEITSNVEFGILKVQALDNGLKVSNNPRGMGSALLDELTLSWSRKDVVNGHQVNFDVALSKTR
ncbi:MAG: hypothetical protein F2704_06060 [Actinobacteria bacterium]|uniref:Unannotated protein n=1 Tax=freshwater metagenome TaxID=449393 RepID=A0A6J6LH66_9ZZZZ|nr:hypothetical protein [Actinomycetota bacterium]MSX24946.1 hypothetical protein [Actinomycetota bacterium]MSY46256.1 hypothetical protein [Actinomycetota bacterium]MSY57804.1 hypothetical protein [Actinomycetota bacterium]MTB00680.1 hypothetical protein [Actinomycetota bacterium]